MNVKLRSNGVFEWNGKFELQRLLLLETQIIVDFHGFAYFCILFSIYSSVNSKYA